MRILNLNVNCFGGSENHLMEHKKFNYYGKEVIDWNSWSKIDKKKQVKDFCSYLEKKSPNIVVLQEFELNNSEETYTFIDCMQKRGYELIGDIPKFEVSMTVMFILLNNNFSYEFIKSPHKRSARSCSIRINDCIIYGTHVPPEYDEGFWNELINFYDKFKNENLILIGDFNAYSEGTKGKSKFNELLSKEAIDVWLKRGNSDSTPTEKKYKGRLDYIIASPKMYENICWMDIDYTPMNKNISDHAALITEINEKSYYFI